jgi:bifunctional N-acetylglucosamine-1-phosphate-uridyltransferase/glucosamine-1-phosphate-acetyltransferase GlmU-like protein
MWMSICAVIPAAGEGRRLNLTVPKLMAPLNGTVTVWSILRDAIMPEVDRIAVVIAPASVPLFKKALAEDKTSFRVSIAVQEKPTGMGDAVFAAWPVWRDFESIVVIWGDQANLSANTLRLTLNAHRQARTGVTIPLVRVAKPYVQYDFDGDGRLYRVRQTRELENVDAEGYSDVGIFAICTRGLHVLWQQYRASCVTGSTTGEINFLPFLVFLSQQGWPTRTVLAACVEEARGINTPTDLDFARQRLARSKGVAAGG